jgi:hypothetical protein
MSQSFHKLRTLFVISAFYRLFFCKTTEENLSVDDFGHHLFFVWVKI